MRCFNHTLQLSAKALLRPFSAKMDDEDENEEADDDDMDVEDPNDFSYLNADIDEDDGGDEDALDIGGEEEDEEVDDDGIDELDELEPLSRSALSNDTKEVRYALSKVYIHFALNLTKK